MKNRIVLHVDFDYFYAQCEEIRDKSLRARPVIVCVYSDRGGESGAVATANYRAREYGVKSGMPIILAKEKLRGVDEAAFLPTDHDYYSDISERAMKAIQEYADVFEYVGRDEAYLDISSRTEGDYGRAAHLGQQLKNRIREELGMTCSVGISPNKLLSKMASDFRKPDGLTIVPPEKAAGFVESLDIRDIPGIGKQTEKRMRELGLDTVARLASEDIFSMMQNFGRKGGTYIHNAVRGINDDPVSIREPRIQYSRIKTLPKDSLDESYLMKNMEGICDELYRTVSQENQTFRAVGIQIIQSDMRQRTKSRTLRGAASGIDELKKAASELLTDALADQQKKVRRLGVRVSDLSDISGQRSIESYF